MTSILNLAEAALYVTDLDRAIGFYTRALDLPLTARFEDAAFLQTGPDSTLILFDLEKLEHRNSPIPAHGAHGRGHVALAVPAEEMDAWRIRLQSLGVTIEHEQDWPQGTHSIYFRDPDDNSLELIDAQHYPKVNPQ
ncbi:MAG: VOC family protein [Anaerolineales bacterium]|jgi:catechol 2,3-dioxygenase-like lactoylglutathione lyase family enzyme